MFKPSLVAALLAFSGLFVVAQEQPPRPAIPPDTQIEQFLLHARILHTHGVGKGITGSLRATLSDGTTTHDAQIQQIDEYRSQFQARPGPNSISATAGRSTWPPTDWIGCSG